jgi:hypothetical protein
VHAFEAIGGAPHLLVPDNTKTAVMLARQIGGFCAGFVLLQHTNDLLFREPCSLHLSVL